MKGKARPDLASDLTTLASVAARLHADRVAALTPEDPRIASMASVAAILDAARNGRAIGAVAVPCAALRADLADTTRRATERALARSGDQQAQETARALAAIAWHFDPVSPAIDTPQIVFCHTTTLAIRTRIAADRAAPSTPALPQPARQRSQTPAPAVAGCRHKDSGPLFGAAA